MEYYYEDLVCKPSAPVAELAPRQPTVRRVSKIRRVLWCQCVASCVLCALILTSELWWQEGSRFLKETLVGGEIGTVEAAAHELIENVVAGESVPEAIAVFCQEVLNAQDSN